MDTNYKHYNTTIRGTEKRVQLRTMESSPKKQKPPLPERKYKQEPFKVEPLETIKTCLEVGLPSDVTLLRSYGVPRILYNLKAYLTN